MSTFNVPGVGEMTSTALTEKQMSVVFQALVLQCLGVTVDPANPIDPGYFGCRIDWPTPGQPGFTVVDDVAFVAAVMEPEDADQQYERQQPFGEAIAGVYTDEVVYTRTWRISLVFYGPNAGDRARQVKSCLDQGFVNDTLAASMLYLLQPLGTPRRNPELFQAQWFERTDLSFRLYEKVTETLDKGAICSVELEIVTEDDAFASGIVAPPPPIAYGPQIVMVYTSFAISAFSVVALTSSGLQLADASDPTQIGTVLGIVTTGTPAGSTASVQTSGEITDPAWNWTIGQPVFLGTLGRMTQTPPSAPGFNQVMATPLSATILLITIRTPTLLA